MGINLKTVIVLKLFPTFLGMSENNLNLFEILENQFSFFFKFFF